MIRITFADGSHEDRDDDSPCLPTLFDPPRKHPGEERWYLHFPDARHPFSFCGIDVRALESMRGFENAYVWRITSGDSPAVAGEWVAAKAETFEEQIARLTAERDAAMSALRHVVRLGNRDPLGRRQAVWHAEALLAGEEVPPVEQRLSEALSRVNELAASCLEGDKIRGRTIWRLQNRLARRKRQAKKFRAQRIAEKARADAAEKRLADLRAWAAPMTPHYDMMDAVVARIDGEDA